VAAGVATAEKVDVRPFASAGDMREALTLMLAEVERDSELGARMRSVHAAYRFSFSDLGLVLNVASDEAGESPIRWKFSDRVDWKPGMTLEMDSAVANRYLQGRENLAIAVARGVIRCSTDVRSALSLAPIIRDLSERYRRVIERHYPELLLP